MPYARKKRFSSSPRASFRQVISNALFYTLAFAAARKSRLTEAQFGNVIKDLRLRLISDLSGSFLVGLPLTGCEMAR